MLDGDSARKRASFDTRTDEDAGSAANRKSSSSANKEILTDKGRMEDSGELKGNPKYQDSFFRSLFKEERYRKALYLFLHSEDSDVEDSEFENIELDNVLNIDIYNDVCFTVRNRLIILAEHQSTLNRNMPIRIFLYLAEEYKRLLIKSEFCSALYTVELVKIPRPEFYVVYTGDDACCPVLNLSDAFLECSSVNRNLYSRLELCVPVLTADMATGALAEYFDVIRYIKEEKARWGSLEIAVRNAILKYQSGYEISDFIRNQKGVYDILLEQMSREEYLERQIEATKQVLTRQITEQVTEQVTERVTEQVTERVTEQVTERVTRDAIVLSYKMLLDIGAESNQAFQTVMRNYNISENRLKEILNG